MADAKTYQAKKDADARQDSHFLNTIQGKAFIKRRILPRFEQPIDAPTEFERGVQEGERMLSREILELYKIGVYDE
jgi:hypothetical protein